MAAPLLSQTTRPRSWGYDAAFGDRLFRLAVGPGRELTIRTAPLEAPRVNTASSPEESSPEFGLIYARSQFDGGEGLFRAHVEGAAPNRYWDSKGITVSPPEPGEFPEFRLAKAMDEKRDSASVGQRLATDGESLWQTDATTIYRTDNPEAAAPTFVEDNPHLAETATTVGGLAILGDELYAALGANGIHRRDEAGAWAHWSDLEATRVWSVKGRIVASDGAALYEVLSAGAAPSALITLSSGDTWASVADGGSHVLAAASDGYVYAFSTETGALVLAAQTLFEGEQPTAVGATQGVVGIGTQQGNIGRLWVGTLLESGQVANLQLLREWSEGTAVTQRTPSAIVGDRTSLYTAVAFGNDRVDVWRYELSSAGLSRHRSIDGASGCSRGISFVKGSLWLAICSEGLYREEPTFVESGYLIGPLGDFFSATDKSWIGARLETGDIVDGMRASLYFTSDSDALNDDTSSSWVRLTTRDSGGDDPGEIAMSNVVARALAGMVRLEPSTDRTASPVGRAFSFRAYPSSGEGDVIVTLPVNVSDQIERRGMARRRVHGRGAQEYAALLAIEGRPTTLRIFTPKQELTVRGLVEEVATPIQAITHRGSTTMISQVRIRGRRTTGSGTTSGVGTFGTYHLFGTTPTFGEIS